MWPSPPQYKQRPSSIRIFFSSGVSFLLPDDKSMGPGAVPVAVVVVRELAAGVRGVVVVVRDGVGRGVRDRKSVV